MSQMSLSHAKSQMSPSHAMSHMSLSCEAKSQESDESITRHESDESITRLPTPATTATTHPHTQANTSCAATVSTINKFPSSFKEAMTSAQKKKERITRCCHKSSFTTNHESFQERRSGDLWILLE